MSSRLPNGKMGKSKDIFPSLRLLGLGLGRERRRRRVLGWWKYACSELPAAAGPVTGGQN